MKRLVLPLFLLVFLCACTSVHAEDKAAPAFGQGIMVGEVRDLGIANMLVQTALTGHLAFSTLHSNDCPGTLSSTGVNVRTWRER